MTSPFDIKWTKYIPNRPTSKQLAFLMLNKEVALFGGALGGGKSDVLLMAALQYVDVPGYAAMIFRKSLTDLKQPGALIDRSMKWLAPYLASKEVKWSASEHTFYFPTTWPDGSPGHDAKLCFGYIGDAEIRERYQSSEFQYIAFDELTTWVDSKDWEFMFSRIRQSGCPIHKADSNGKPQWNERCIYCQTLRSVPKRMRAACLDEGEVLTQSGWKDIREVQVGELVASVNPNTGATEYKPVEWVYAGPNDKPMVHIEKKNLDISMTCDHRVMFQRFGKSQYDIAPWDSLPNKSLSLVRHGTSFYRDGKPIEIPCGISRNVFYQLLGWFLSDGSVNHNPRKGNYKIIITQLKDSQNAVRELFESIGLRYNYSSNGDFQITNKELWQFFYSLGYAHEKYVPRKFMEAASSDELQILFTCLMRGDGHLRTNSYQYISTSPRLVDDVSELGALLGFKTQISKTVLDNSNHRDRYTVYLTRQNNNLTKVDRDTKGRNDCREYTYDGNVYCIKVADNENFIVRQRGCVWVSGNTNPGGSGGTWVKNWFRIKPDPEKYPSRKEALIALQQGEVVRFVGTDPNRVFIPSFLEDNPFLDRESYDKMLDNMSEQDQDRLRNGNWEFRPDSRFKRVNARYFTIYDEAFHLPHEIVRRRDLRSLFATVDTAATVKEGPVDDQVKRGAPSWTVISTWGITKDYKLLWLHMKRFRKEIPDVVENIVDQYKLWKHDFVKIEYVGTGLGPAQYAELNGVPVIRMKKNKDKLTNATAALMLMKAGRIYFPENAPWLETAEDEVFGWTGLPTEEDDIIDTLSDAANEVSITGLTQASPPALHVNNARGQTVKYVKMQLPYR